MEKKMRHILLIVISMLHFSMVHGQALVSGWVLEQDSITPIEGASIVFSGFGAEGDTLLFRWLPLPRAIPQRSSLIPC